MAHKAVLDALDTRRGIVFGEFNGRASSVIRPEDRLRWLEDNARMFGRSILEFRNRSFPEHPRLIVDFRNNEFTYHQQADDDHERTEFLLAGRSLALEMIEDWQAEWGER